MQLDRNSKHKTELHRNLSGMLGMSTMLFLLDNKAMKTHGKGIPPLVI